MELSASGSVLFYRPLNVTKPYEAWTPPLSLYGLSATLSDAFGYPTTRTAAAAAVCRQRCGRRSRKGIETLTHPGPG